MLGETGWGVLDDHPWPQSVDPVAVASALGAQASAQASAWPPQVPRCPKPFTRQVRACTFTRLWWLGPTLERVVVLLLLGILL
jgi:hypothetical protein